MNLAIESIAHHRNGVCGAPFYVVTFSTVVDGDPNNHTRNFVATVFPTYVEHADGTESYGWGPIPGEFYNPQVAVLDRDLLADGDIAFGSNSWRGDDFADDLLAAINEWSDLPFEERYPDALPADDNNVSVVLLRLV